MDDLSEELVVDVRASTSGFAADIAQMRETVDGTLLNGFERAGAVLERSLLGAIRAGSLGFDDLKSAASRALDQIAAQALQLGLNQLFGGSKGGSDLAGAIGGIAGALFGLPGRATGGPVSPGRGHVVGERGPELFVPTSAGRVEANGSAPLRDTRVNITVATPRGTSAPVALQRSSRQIASAVRRSVFPF
ncbi:MAG: tail tape measure protein [Pontixanthobacter sp.]